jgi:hypothetical protein
MKPAGLPLEANRAALQQGLALLELLSDQEYAESPAGRPPIGPQYRHVLEHYQAFFGGLGTGRVDYDARARDELLERSRGAALAATHDSLAALDALRGQPDRPIEVQMETEAGIPDWRASSAGRELQFLLSHTLHHFAMIRQLLPDPVQALGADFGVAPSTLTFRRSTH